MPLGSVIALLCAFFVIFFLPYMEKKDKKKSEKAIIKL
ncbi:MAG: erm Leader peptide [Staphylococcus equorum]